MEEWAKLKRRCPKAKLVCIDVVPNTTHQVKEQKDILRVGGFSDAVFDVVATWLNGDDDWVKKIERTEV
jgi:60 kDa SS-A/Ro ribonucleoprotein